MVDYLKRHGFLWPTYAARDNPRGRVRYYSYRDLVIARLIQRLREAGIQLGRLKEAVGRIAQEGFWADGLSPTGGLDWLVSDGRACHLRDNDGFVADLMGTGKRSFAFV